tara:strand:- start:91 stop:522 length:432 start_codon:yes stop_codon:yes gene_type:complete
MPSQIKVDEIKNVAGQYKIKTNVLEGQTTAGSITVQGEGTATTNLQQGLCKVWHHGSQDGATLEDSFNVGSLTDTGTGQQTVNLTNNMSNANYAAQIGVHFGQSRFLFCENIATSSYKGSVYAAANNAYQDAHQNTKVHGDLA